MKKIMGMRRANMHQFYMAFFLALIQKLSNQTRNLRLSHPHVLS